MAPGTDILRTAANRFDLRGPVTKIEALEGGHINGSWRIEAGNASYLLQRINGHVFREPEQVMENVVRVTAHLREMMQQEGVPAIDRRALTLVPTHGGASHHLDADGACWRLYLYLEGTRAYGRAPDADVAYQGARAFGAFHRRMSTYRGPRLHDTIPHFHDTPRRLDHFEQAVAADVRGRRAGAALEIERLHAYRGLADALLAPHRAGTVPERLVHNDAKLANVLFDEATGDACCVVDLDTVMPGLSLYDVGDMVRSMATTMPEDATDATHTRVDPQRYQAVLQGYQDEMGALLTPAERGLLITAGPVITYEQALRFLTDHLEGDAYYRTAYPGQNLDRCRTQLALLDALDRPDTAGLTRG